MTRAVIFSVIGVAIVFLLAAFIMWDINPSKWTMDARIFCALMMPTGAWFGGAAHFVTKE